MFLFLILPATSQAVSWTLFKENMGVYKGDPNADGIKISDKEFKFSLRGFECVVEATENIVPVKKKTDMYSRYIKCTKDGITAQASAMCGKGSNMTDAARIDMIDIKTSERVHPTIECEK